LFVFGDGKRRGEKRKKQEEIEMFATAVRLFANKARV